VRDWADYLAKLSRGDSARADEETVDAEAAALERAWLGLRTRTGLPLSELSSQQHERIAKWQEGGLAAVTDGIARLTAHGWLVLDRLATELV
jgi:coproporphyrinogen III oxidase-like Fe-S oxidoreductase